MRYVDRGAVPVPQSLAGPSAPVQQEKDAAIEFYRTYDATLRPRPKGYPFEQYKGHDVTVSLRSLFNDKCAYCETDVGDDMDVEHFRPKGGVTEDEAHPGYWWLAHSWENLFAACTPCNQNRYQHIATEHMNEEELLALRAKKPDKAFGKANQFPIAGIRASFGSSLAEERPHLIDPTVDDPADYLKWSQSEYSVVLANPEDQWSKTRALATISVFALNRLKLVQSRTRILNVLRYQAERTLMELEEDLVAGGSPRLIQRALRRVDEMRQLQAPGMPHTAMVKAFIDSFVADLSTRIAP
ncbi:HNH endonuclease family protein [Pseudomonas chlororaphis]|uniref:hypothetical protein n=1 Tax=Pseudomonas chlororaphis TaxID=587753 RepID=UPI000BE3369A|nr:hypothetical protein [Pseudomonas chlororaphis]